MTDDPSNVPQWSSLADFLAKAPPGTRAELGVRLQDPERGTRGGLNLPLPAITLDCPSSTCDGIRTFQPREQLVYALHEDRTNYVVLEYVCRNCFQVDKAIAVGIVRKNRQLTEFVKLGEEPPFGDRTPARVVTLIGPDRELFLKGRRCEMQGLGIGAFAYYRRIVEGHRDRLFDKIIDVAKKLDAKPEQIRALEVARDEQQFQKAAESVKNIIPDALKIDGHNPMTLLHRALSEGLHDHPDDRCLQIARSIRLVLFELAEKSSAVLKDDTELKNALSELLNPKES